MYIEKNIVNYNFIYNKTNTKNNHTVITVQRLDAKSIEIAKLYMAGHFPGLVQTS